MIIKYVKFKNFLSFGDKISTVYFDRPGIWYVVGLNKKDRGSNGAGKSTAIIDSISFALFGRITKDIKQEDIVNNKIKKNCLVEINFLVNNSQYLIKRYKNHEKYGNELKIYKNDELLNFVSKKEAQNFINNLININFKGFVSSIILSQEKIVNFADKEPKERKKVLEELLHLNFITRFHKNVKFILRRVNRKYHDRKIIYNEEKKLINNLELSLQKYIDKIESNILLNDKKIKLLDERLKELNSINIEVLKEKKERFKILSDKYKNNEIKIKHLKEKINYNTNSYNQNKSKIEEVYDKIKEIENLPGICPVCGSKIKDYQLKDYIEDINNQYETLTKENQALDKKIKKINKKLKSLLNLKDKISEELNEIKKDKYLQIDLDKINTEINNLKTEKKLLKSEKFNPSEDSFIKDSLKRLKKIKRKKNKVKRELDKLNEEIVYYEWWKDAFSNNDTSIKSFLFQQTINPLNKYINYYIDFFGYNIEYKFDNMLNEEIKKEGEPIVFNQLSGGEKRAIEVSLLFALYKLSNFNLIEPINILILDEVLSSRLDEVRKSKIFEIINSLNSNNRTIFIIELEEYFRENLDSKLITVVKNESGFSQIEYAKES